MLGNSQRGDTLVEVLLSFAILSVVAVGAYSLMNRGVAEAYDSLESSQVRTGINQQTELLGYFRDSYLAAKAAQQPTTVYPASVWNQIRTRAITNRTTTPSAPATCNTALSNSFYLNFAAATSQYQVVGYTAATPPTLASPGSGLWIEPIASSDGSGVPGFQPYIDFYVKACWDAAGSSPSKNISTVVRLYEQP